jgi:hypothetical protein
MPECGSPSTYCSGDDAWTYHCTAEKEHAPGEHMYTLDDGQPALPDVSGG